MSKRRNGNRICPNPNCKHFFAAHRFEEKAHGKCTIPGCECLSPQARLDADKTAKPLTQIVAVHKAGECILPGIGAEEYLVNGNNK